MPDIHGIDFGRPVLEEAVGETAGGSAQVNGGLVRDGELEVAQGVFELVSAAADILLAGQEREGIGRLHAVTGFARRLGVDRDLPGHDPALGFFAAVAQAALDQRAIEALHAAR